MDIFRIDEHISAIDNMLLDTAGIGTVYVVQGDEIAIIETGTPRSIRYILAGLEQLGIAPASVAHILTTHIHMDHAGGAGSLAQVMPEANVYIHSSMMPYLAEPSRLVAGTRRAVGEVLWATYGDIVPLAPERMLPSENLRLDLGRGIVLEAIAAPGHSPDHMVFFDTRSGGLFIGDAAGTSLPRWKLVRPVTPPPSYDLAAQQETIARLRQRDWSQLFFTHWGPNSDPATTLATLDQGLSDFVGGVRAALAAGEDDPASIAQRLIPISPDAPDPLVIANWAEMSVAGIIRYEKKRAESATG